MKITIYTIETPVDIDTFVTPDFQTLIDWYPDYCRLSVQADRTPADPQPYITKICDELDRCEGTQAWFHRMFAHFGIEWMEDSISQMKAGRARGT